MINEREFYQCVDQLAAVKRFRAYASYLSNCLSHRLFEGDEAADKENLLHSVRWYRAILDEEKVKLSQVTSEFNKLIMSLIQNDALWFGSTDLTKAEASRLLGESRTKLAVRTLTNVLAHDVERPPVGGEIVAQAAPGH